MVCIDIIVKNETKFPVKEEIKPKSQYGGIGERVGYLTAKPNTNACVVLRPDSGFMGVEKGITCTLHVTCGTTPYRLVLDFPAVGKDDAHLEAEVRPPTTPRACVRPVLLLCPRLCHFHAAY